MGVLSHHSKGGLEVVMNLVDVLVDGAMVEKLVDPVVPRVLQHQTTYHLETQHIPGRGG